MSLLFCQRIYLTTCGSLECYCIGGDESLKAAFSVIGVGSFSKDCVAGYNWQ